MVIQIILAILVLSFPIIFYRIYFSSLENRAKQMIKSYTTDSSEFHADIKVWFKNFDILKKKNKFDLNLYQTNYSFNDCDLILDSDYLVVIGKTKVFGKSRYLTPTVFTLKTKGFKQFHDSRIAQCESIRDNGADLELDFIDSAYSNLITLVIKRIDSDLKDKIKNGLQHAV
ncbi:MAG: hypothetical protein Q8928_19195 [Bacteroidota bacterium]|nr:hypothetical protein [Bacteroidota bacterium]